MGTAAVRRATGGSVPAKVVVATEGAAAVEVAAMARAAAAGAMVAVAMAAAAAAAATEASVMAVERVPHSPEGMAAVALVAQPRWLSKSRACTCCPPFCRG